MLSLVSLLLLRTSFGGVINIRNVNDFITFSKNINAGTTFTGSTVYLVSDIDFSEDTTHSFVQIGYFNEYDNCKYFKGTFDGQGHAIRNLHLETNYPHAGFFGYTQGLYAKNFIMDSSCSITSTYSSTYQTVHLGGLFGCSDTYVKGEVFKAENIVNMADVIFKGKISNTLVIGGFTGHMFSNVGDGVTYKNCVNYGNVIHMGSSAKTYMGGIAGYLSSTKKYVYNCLNYGDIIHNGTTTGALYVGGIGGGINSGTVVIENCVNAGRVINTKSTITSNNIVAYNNGGTLTVKHCFWTFDVKKTSTITYTDSNQIEINTESVKELNDYAETNGWNKWAFNTHNDTITFNVNYEDRFDLSSQLILLPDLIGNGGDITFDGWYTDMCLTQKFASNEISEEVTFYGSYGTLLTVTLDSNYDGNSDVCKKNVIYNEAYREFPVPIRKGYTFIGWYDNNNENITKDTIVTTNSDHTLLAHWDPNNYTIEFDVNGGDSLPEDEEKTYVIFNTKYNDLPQPSKTGFTFIGWFNENNEIVTNETFMTKDSDHTIYAHWDINNYTIIIDLGNGVIIEEIVDYDKDIPYPLEDPKKTGYSFDGWNVSFTKVPAENTAIKAKWIPNKYNVTFDVNSGDELSEDEAKIEFTYDGTYDSLPVPTKKGYKFVGWFTEDNVEIKIDMTVNIIDDQTFRAEWTPNKYNVTFNVNDGDELDDSKTKMEFTYDGTYDSLPVPTKKGYKFVGWFTKDNVEITSETAVEIIEDSTFYAHWVEIYVSQSGSVGPTKYVEIVFNKKDMTDDEIREILKKFTNKEFEIVRTDDNETGETKVIIKFKDVEDAEKLIAAINEASGSDTNYIRNADFNSGVDHSASGMVYPFMLFNILVM